MIALNRVRMQFMLLIIQVSRQQGRLRFNLLYFVILFGPQLMYLVDLLGHLLKLLQMVGWLEESAVIWKVGKAFQTVEILPVI